MTDEANVFQTGQLAFGPKLLKLKLLGPEDRKEPDFLQAGIFSDNLAQLKFWKLSKSDFKLFRRISN